ncbi:hypothetical protein, partial [Pseudomonas sp. GW460-12]|uniref:hypothetical protein n=1 Tax=Pseudomonas sp. GW460-12 TaxID=2070621 RepID=UPI001C482D85
ADGGCCAAQRGASPLATTGPLGTTGALTTTGPLGTGEAPPPKILAIAGKLRPRQKNVNNGELFRVRLYLN